jgi:hypothetical protein
MSRQACRNVSGIATDISCQVRQRLRTWQTVPAAPALFGGSGRFCLHRKGQACDPASVSVAAAPAGHRNDRPRRRRRASPHRRSSRRPGLRAAVAARGRERWQLAQPRLLRHQAAVAAGGLPVVAADLPRRRSPAAGPRLGAAAARRGGGHLGEHPAAHRAWRVGRGAQSVPGLLGAVGGVVSSTGRIDETQTGRRPPTSTVGVLAYGPAA